jgi:serine/threonine-protein kinase
MEATAKPGLEDDALRSFATSRVGQTLGGRWTLTDVLGVGGTAGVYAATHRNGARVAIKVLHPELSRNARLRRRFLAEGYAANRVAHPGAVVVLDEAEEADGTAFLVMELLQGQSLDRLLSARGKLPWREVAELTIGILDVLAAAHDRNVLHRDLKPSNVFLTSTGQIKLLDFGTAKVGSWDSEHIITRSGTTLGTPAFMAPELAAGSSDNVDALTDIWAVGATMFQLLTDRTVHVALSVHEAIVAAATRPAPRLRSLCEELPGGLANIVDRALSYDKSDRFPNARAMQAELCNVLGISPIAVPLSLATAPEVETAEVTRAVPSTRWRWALALGVAPLLVIVLEQNRADPAPPSVATSAPRSAAQMLQPSTSGQQPDLAAPRGSENVGQNPAPPSPEAAHKSAPHTSAGKPKHPTGPATAPSAPQTSEQTDLLDRWH